MKCHVCGCEMNATETSLPFKIDARSILIIKEVPVLECPNCPEYLLADDAMQQVEALIAKADTGAELEVVRYAA